MPYLKVFGPPALLNESDGQTLECSPLSLLLAAYVILKHQGEMPRDAARQTFYPLQPQAPAAFSPTACRLYKALWERGKVHDKDKDEPLRTCVLRETEGSAANTGELADAHTQLRECRIITAANRKDEDWSYELHPKFSFYLHESVKIKNEKFENTHKTQRHKAFSINLTALRKALKTALSPQEADKKIPSGRSGEAKEKLIIDLDSSVPMLEEALREADFEKIKQAYPGPFLENIEKRLRGDIWLSPEVCVWLREEREHHAHRVSVALQQLIERIETESYELVREIQVFCRQSHLEDAELQQVLQARLPQTESLSDAADTPKSIIFHRPPDSNEALPVHTRNHLINKMRAECEWLLQGADAQSWIATEATLKTLRRGVYLPQPQETRLPAISAEFSQTLLRQSQGFGFLLGEAGMGKTLLLYHIMQTLLERAQSDPYQAVPLLFSLADHQPGLAFETWLKYQLVGAGLPQKWIERDYERVFSRKHCLLLLDGFDHLPPRERPAYLQAMNRFIREQGESELGGLLICSRPQEYFTARDAAGESDFRFFAEAELQPLDEVKVNHYIETHAMDAGRLQRTLSAGGEAGSLANSPLGLTLLVQHEDALPPDADAQSGRRALIKAHVNTRIEQTDNQEYTPAQVNTWLAALAKTLDPGGVFHLEQLSPAMLGPKQRKQYEWLFILLFGLIFGLMAGAVSGVIFGDRVANHVLEKAIEENCSAEIHPLPAVCMTLNTWGAEYAIPGKLSLIAFYGLLGGILGLLAAAASRVLAAKRLRAAVFLGLWLVLFLGLTGWLMDGEKWGLLVVVYYGILGLALGVMADPAHLESGTIRLHQEVRPDYRVLLKNRRHAWSALLFLPLCVGLMWSLRQWAPNVHEHDAVLHGLLFGLAFTLVYTLYRAQRHAAWQEKLFYPAQKFDLALRRAAKMTLATGFMLMSLLSLLALLYLESPGHFSLGLRVGFLLAFILGFLFYGGAELLKHAALRWVLYRANLGPLRYEPFLEYVKHTGLLLPRGEGYVFKHEWFQEYFAEVPRSD